MLPPPPRSTLFPYTTLFRSHLRTRRRNPHRRGREGRVVPRRLRRVEEHGDASRVEADPPDRKSTRLNSSHSSISYAVFCLKKKNSTVRANTRACRLGRGAAV